MNFRDIKSVLLLGAASFGAFSAAPVMAQGAQGAEEASGTDIIVTARRVEEKLQDVPISITVMNSQQISDRNITIANDLTTYTP